MINLGEWDDPDLEASDTTDQCELTPLGEVILNPAPEDKQPCQNVGGFLHPVGIYTPGELDAAAQTVFGEMSSHYNDKSRTEAEAIASIIFNRSEAIKSGTAPSDWGSDPSLTGVVTAPGQFAGYATGQNLRDSGVELNEGERNCNRLQTAGSAVAWLATNRAARGSYLYMCAQGHVGAEHPDDVTINHNVFSTQPLGCRP